MTLSSKLSAIQEEFKAQKSRYNSFGKYNYRSAEDILEALKPINAKYGVYFVVNETIITESAVPILVSTASISDGEQTIKATAVVGVDLAQKGMQVPQAFGSASSYGKKYALGNLLLIDDTADADATNSHGKPSAAPTKFAILSTTDKQYEKAVKYLSDGGSIDAIKAKYELTPEVEAELLKIAK